MPGPWLTERPPPGPVRNRLFAVPYAGGGASVFEPWRQALPTTALSVVRLPGREARFREPALTDVQAVVDELAPVVAARVAADPTVPWAVFGHSLGALLAYELVARLVTLGCPEPGVLMVSGADAPHVPRDEAPVSWLADDALLDYLRQMGGTSDEVLAHRELVELLLPTIRADFRLLETYTAPRRPSLSCPVVTYCGTADENVRREAVDRWSELTTAGVQHRILDGGHFTITENAAVLAGLVAADLDRHLG